MPQLSRRGPLKGEEAEQSANECGYETDCEKKSFKAKLSTNPDEAIDVWITKNYQTLFICHIVVAIFLWIAWMNKEELGKDLENLPFFREHDHSVLSNVTQSG